MLRRLSLTEISIWRIDGLTRLLHKNKASTVRNTCYILFFRLIRNKLFSERRFTHTTVPGCPLELNGISEYERPKACPLPIRDLSALNQYVAVNENFTFAFGNEIVRDRQAARNVRRLSEGIPGRPLQLYESIRRCI
jgi:hypothetical protein